MAGSRTMTAAPAAAIIIFGENGTVLKIDGRVPGLLGYPKQEIEGMHLSSLLADPTQADMVLRSLAREDDAGTLKADLVSKDGSAFEAVLSGLALPCACSGRKHIICMVSGTIQTEGADLESGVDEERSGSLADLLPEIVFETDAGGKLTFVNQKAYETTGYSHEDFRKGLRALDIIAPQDRARAARNIMEIFAGRGDGPHEYIAVRKDGTTFPVMIHSLPVFDGNKPAGLRGIMIDITEQKRAETDLRIVDSAMASSINAIAIADMEGRLTYVNAAFLMLWGYEREQQVLRRPVIEFWQMAERAREVIDALQQNGGWIGELVGKRKDGSTFDVETAATLVTDDTGVPIRMMASFIDITDRKRSEEQRQRELMQREKLQGVLEMAGATCHEFNQPMQVISGYAELLLRDRSESSPGYEELKRIRDASDRMIEITRKLQQIARYETREYVGGAIIIDIDKSSGIAPPDKAGKRPRT